GAWVSQLFKRIDGILRPVGWEVALNEAAEGLQKVVAAHGAAAAGFLASPMSTVEELYLLAQIARGLKSANIDHRLRQLDFRAQENEPAFPHLGLKIAAVERLDGVLVIGSNLRHEMPLLAHRIRKAAVRNAGAKVAFLNPRRFDYMFPWAASPPPQTRTRGPPPAGGARRGAPPQQAGAGGRPSRRGQRCSPGHRRRADE